MQFLSAQYISPVTNLKEKKKSHTGRKLFIILDKALQE